MRFRRTLLSAVAAAALGAGGIVAATPASAVLGQPGDCDAYPYNGSPAGYATIICWGPASSPHFIPRAICQPRFNPAPSARYNVDGAPIVAGVMVTIYCHAGDPIQNAAGIQSL